MAKKRQSVSRQTDDLFDSLTEPKSPDKTTTRKRRSDYKGTPSRKKDYHRGTTTLHVRVSDALADEIKRRVESGEADSVNAWLLQLITKKLGIP